MVLFSFVWVAINDYKAIYRFQTPSRQAAKNIFDSGIELICKRQAAGGCPKSYYSLAAWRLGVLSLLHRTKSIQIAPTRSC